MNKSKLAHTFDANKAFMCRMIIKSNEQSKRQSVSSGAVLDDSVFLNDVS